MSINIIIAIDQDIHDPLTMGQTNIVSEIFKIASEVINNSGKVVVQRQYDNALPEVLCEFDNLDELSAWKERLNDAQIKLGREEIE